MSISYDLGHQISMYSGPCSRSTASHGRNYGNFTWNLYVVYRNHYRFGSRASLFYWDWNFYQWNLHFGRSPFYHLSPPLFMVKSSQVSSIKHGREIAKEKFLAEKTIEPIKCWLFSLRHVWHRRCPPTVTLLQRQQRRAPAAPWRTPDVMIPLAQRCSGSSAQQPKVPTRP